MKLICRECRAPLTGRWAKKFCSGSCAAKTQHRENEVKRRLTYEQKPRECAHCSNAMPYEKRFTKFCNQSCAATFNNARRKYDASKSQQTKKKISETLRSRFSMDEWLENAKMVHGSRYDYSRSIYLGADKRIEIVCLDHGSFYVKPGAHLRGAGCRVCHVPSRERQRMQWASEFPHKAKLVHGDRYDYSKVQYETAHKPVEIVCEIHGSFFQRPNDHLSGSGCRQCTHICSVSSGETAWLDALNVPVKFRQKFLNIRGRLFCLDAYDPELMVAYEYDGDFWHGNPELYDKEAINKAVGVTFGELYDNTLEKRRHLLESGISIVQVWEHEYQKGYLGRTMVAAEGCAPSCTFLGPPGYEPVALTR